MKCTVEEKCEEVGIKMPRRYVGLFILLTIIVTVIMLKFYIPAVSSEVDYFSSHGIPSTRVAWFIVILVVPPFILVAFILLFRDVTCILAVDSIPEEEIKSMLENKGNGGEGGS
ncbi:MAG: hypothetical protein QW607_09925 [Desulfurococcaceae archaeon]